MPIAFDRTTCCDLNETISREWLITNGLGGYAAGTVAGTLTRRQHGLLVASPTEGDAPQLLLAKLDEEIVFDQRTYYLGTNEYKDGTLNPAGFVHLESFRLEEGFPVYTYHLGGIDGIVLEKRIWMPQGLNTTYIHYRVVRTASPEQGGLHNNSQQLSRSSRFVEDAHASQRELSLTLLPFVSYRSIHEPLHGKLDWQFEVDPQILDYNNAGAQEQIHNMASIAGCTIRAAAGARSYSIFAVGHPNSQTAFLPTGVWYWNLLHREEQIAGPSGQPATDDLYLPGVFRARLWPGDDVELTLIVTAEELSGQSFNIRQLKHAYAEAVEHQRDYLQAQRYFGEGGVTTHTHPVLPLSAEQPGVTGMLSAEEFMRTLLQAGNRFLIRRVFPLNEVGGRPSLIFSNMQTIPVILSGFHDMTERTRDMLISLPGLTLTTQRYSEARRILLTLSHCFKEGLLPERLPTVRRPLDDEDYGSVDTTLWYFYALDAYLRATHDDDVLDDLYPHLEECIARLVRGTRNGIYVDAHDGLLVAYRPGKALTWMNAYAGSEGKVGNEPLTPRSGKPVEVNALWYHALSLMQEWSERLYQRGSIEHVASVYGDLRQQCRGSFNERFWYSEGGHLYDVIDGPQGDDASLRPNQLFALSLRYPALDTSRRRAVLGSVTQHLLTPYGLRALAPQSDDYTGRIGERNASDATRLRGQYNGGAWPWLLGAYVDALLQVEGLSEGQETRPGDRAHKARIWRKGLALLAPFRRQAKPAMLGMPAAVYDGDEPQKPHLQLASARSVAELLRVYKLLAQLGVRYSDRALPV